MKAYTLKIRGGVEIDSMGKKAGKGALIQTELSATLGVAQDQYLFQPIGLHGDISPTLDASYYKGCGMRQGIERELVFEPVCYSLDAMSSNSMKSSNPHSGCRVVDTWRTLDTTNQDPSKNQGGIAVLEKATVYNGENITSPLNRTNPQEGDPCHTLSTDSRNYLVAPVEEEVTHYIVRRLTPVECARLQGFPDYWGQIDQKDDFTDDEYHFWLDVRNTHAEINGKQVKDYTKDQMLKWYNKLHTDTAEYKMWGNGVALPCVLYIMEGIAEHLED